MDTRVALISIIVEQDDAIEELNMLLHEARQYIIGRVFPIVRKGSASSALPSMHRRIRSVHSPEKSDV